MTDSDGKQVQRLGIGKSLTDRLFIEGYLIGEDNQNNDFRLQAFEVEALWQLTEQGEYDIDILLFLEKD